MSDSGSEVHDTTTAQSRPSALPTDTEPHDPTTVRLDGPMAVADEDAGADPYNRTGKFRRAVR